MAGTPFSLVAPGWPGVVGVQGASFNLDAYLAAIGASYYDFTKTDDQFQEATGPTPANTIGQSIGLKLDRGLWGGKTLAQVVAAATNLTVPGSWTMSISGGTATATESPSGTLNVTGDGTNSGRGDQSFTTVSGKIYALKFTVAGATATVSVGTAQGGNTLLNVAIANGNTVTYYFIATSTTTWVRFSRPLTTTSVISAITCKLVPGIPATQSSASPKPTYQTTGAKFDGADDNLLTGYTAGAAENFIVALVTVPATIAANQAIVGSNDVVNGRFYLAISTGGQLFPTCGSNVTAVGPDLRNTEAVVGFTAQGGNELAFVNAASYSATYSGAPNQTWPIRMGSYNVFGSSASPFGGSIKRLVVGRQFLDLPTYLKIRSALLAA